MQVRVEVETCEELRPMNTNQKGGMAASYASGGQYGFSDKVVDGITLTVNSVLLTLKSRAFIQNISEYFGSTSKLNCKANYLPVENFV